MEGSEQDSGGGFDEMYADSFDMDAPAPAEDSDAGDDAGNAGAEDGDASSDDSGEQPPKQTDRVPLPELLAERKARQQYENEARALRQKLEIGNQRLQELAQHLTRQQQPEKPEEPEPDDVLGLALHKVTKLEQQLQEQDKHRQAAEQRAHAERAQEAVKRHVEADIASFRKEHPDYVDAVNHATETLYKMFQHQGLTHEQALEQINWQWHIAGLNAVNNNRSAAEAAYEIAKQLGYKPKVAANPATQLQQRREGQRAVTGGGGSPPGKVRSMEDLIKLSPEDFRKATAGKKWEQMFGKG